MHYDTGLFSLGLISLGNNKKEPEMKGAESACARRPDPAEVVAPLRREAPPTQASLGMHHGYSCQ